MPIFLSNILARGRGSPICTGHYTSAHFLVINKAVSSGTICCLSHSRTLQKPLDGMSFGRDTHVVSSNIVLDRGFGPPQEGQI